MLGGWELSGITSFNSGVSTTVTQAVDPFACVADTSTANGCAAGTYPGGLGIYSPNADIVPRADQVAPVHMIKTQAQWFTTSSFATAQGHFGSAAPGSFLSPGVERIDLGLLKNFRISENISLQMRAEAFNLFNHTNFGNSGGGVGSSLNGIDVGLGDTNFGQATSARMPRTMQFSGKFYF